MDARSNSEGRIPTWTACENLRLQSRFINCGAPGATAVVVVDSEILTFFICDSYT
jgi:hypothetical protein